jgi:hypothetical protein
VAIVEKRVHRLFDKTISLASEHHTGNYPDVLVNLVGDTVSGPTRDRVETRLQVISDHRDSNATLSTLKCFVVDSGKPGAIST